MADDAPKLDPDLGRPLAPEPADRWAIARERLTQYDRDGLSLPLDEVLERFDAALEAAIASKA